MADSPLVNQKYVLEKFPGKGGRVFACIPEILPNKNAPFGWVRVKGKIDDFECYSSLRRNSFNKIVKINFFYQTYCELLVQK